MSEAGESDPERQAETRHKIANIFQLLSTLTRMRLQRAAEPESRRHLSWMLDMVAALGALQHRLNSPGGEDFGLYIEDMAGQWRRSCADRPIEIAVAVQPLQVPDAQLNMTRVRAMDAVVHYRAASVLAGKLPLRAFALDLTLDHGVLTADPVSFSLPHGDLTAHVRLDARPDIPLTDVDARVVNLRMEDFLHNAGPPALEGLVEARARLHGAGGSVHDAASSADGSLTVVAPHGEIRSPKIGVKASQAVGQVVAAVALGAFLSPVAAILPFVDVGLAKNADCAGLTAQAQAQGAPVKAAARAR